MIPVVAGIIHNGDKIILSQRVRGADIGKWEFPGGKLERGESPEEALVRELREEMNITVRVGKSSGCIADWQGGRGEGLLLMFYECEIIDGRPECIDCGGIQALDKAELEHIDLASNDRAFVEKYM